MEYKLTIFITLSALVAAFAIHAQASADAPGAFAQAVSGARPLGLNDAYVAIADDANAIWWNPAGISQLKKSFFTSMYANLYDVDGLSMSSFGFARPTNIGAFGIGITHLRASNIPITDVKGNIIEHSVQSENVLTLSYGNSLFNKWRLGASIRYLRSGEVVESSGFSLDLGLLANPVRRFYFGTMIQQMTSYLTMGDDDESQRLPRNIKMAAAFNVGKASIGLGLENLLSSHYRKISVGCEVKPHRYIALRTSLRAGMREETNPSWSAGMGLIFKGMQIDYAYTDQTSLASTHLVSVSL